MVNPGEDPRAIEQRESLVRSFFRGTGRSYDRVVAITTLGLDAHWKRRLLAHVPRDATSILDLACGTGIVTAGLLQRCPRARVTGVDVTAEYLAVARERFAGSTRAITLIHANAEEVELADTYDVVVSSYIPKYVDPDRLLGQVAPRLVPGARLAIHDFSYPNGFVQRLVWTAYMRMLVVAGPRVFPEWETVFDHRLEDLIRTSHWSSRFREALWRAGFDDIRCEKLSFTSARILSAHLAEAP